MLNAVVEPEDQLLDLDRNRPTVAASFADAEGEVFTVTANHLKSKGDSGLVALVGAAQDYLDAGGTGIVQAERFIGTLKENLLWVRTFRTVEELRLALRAVRRTDNESWLIEGHGHRFQSAQDGDP